jgi:hypothetical protein
MNDLKTIISNSIPENTIYKNKVEWDYPSIITAQVIDTKCGSCNRDVRVIIPSNSYDLVELLKEMGKKVNQLRVKGIEQFKEIRSLERKAEAYTEEIDRLNVLNKSLILELNRHQI